MDHESIARQKCAGDDGLFLCNFCSHYKRPAFGRQRVFGKHALSALISGIEPFNLVFDDILKIAGIHLYSAETVLASEIPRPRGIMSDQFVQKSIVTSGFEFSIRSLLVLLIACSFPLTAQETQEKRSDSPFSGIQFRQIGPFRRGRSGAVTGVQSEPLTFYMGATGGSIFKTVDGGNHWSPIADGQLKRLSAT